MSLPHVYCIGEALLDIIFEKCQPRYATPGGSMLNSAVSLGRAGIPVYLISDFANDQTGDLINDFLLRNGVSTQYVKRYDHGKTAIALAFLDDEQNASYSFYKDYPINRFPKCVPEIHPGDFVLFGSFYSITPSLHDEIIAFVRHARENGAFILYDPNFRKPHLDNLERLRPLIIENISNADMVRGSNEDFQIIFGTKNFEEAFMSVKNAGCNMLVYTKNKDDVEAFIHDEKFSASIPSINPLSTIGAGDAFNAGLIYGILLSPNHTGLPHSIRMDDIVRMGIRFSTEVCLNLENYISLEFANSIIQEFSKP
ncbi:MAG: carbohydrate kinase [Bacteroidota bacterium]